MRRTIGQIQYCHPARASIPNVEGGRHMQTPEKKPTRGA